MNILEAIDHPQIFSSVFRDPASWKAWRAFLAALFALGMSNADVDTFRQCTGRRTVPDRPFSQAWMICGRRAGKSFMMALIAVFLACFKDYGQYLAIGERGTVFVIAADKKQARTILRYIRGILAIPALAKLVERETADAFDLTNRVTIEIGTASFRSVRGYTIVAALLDEIAFWRSEDSASPDFEVLNALLPAMGTIPGAIMLGASSPYARKGVMFDAFTRHFGKDDAPVLVWKAPTRVMNPSFPQAIIDAALEQDAPAAAAEYMAEFRNDLEAFVSREAVEACVDRNIYERAPLADCTYHGFVDPSGGSADSMTLGIAHNEDGIAILDAIREVKPPFSPEAVVADFAALLKTYRIGKVRGDRYAGEWPREQFRKHGVEYLPSDKTKSEIYLETLPILNSRRASLLDDKKMIAQLIGLERRTARSGKDSVDHAPGAHDDRVNSAAGAIVLASRRDAPLSFHVPFTGPGMATILAASGGGAGLANENKPGGWPAGSTQAAAAAPYANLNWYKP